jgi:hypothetical protein
MLIGHTVAKLFLEERKMYSKLANVLKKLKVKMMIIWTTNFNLKTITKRTNNARVMDHGHMPQQSKGKHTIRLGSQESDSTLDHNHFATQTDTLNTTEQSRSGRYPA